LILGSLLLASACKLLGIDPEEIKDIGEGETTGDGDGDGDGDGCPPGGCQETGDTGDTGSDTGESGGPGCSEDDGSCGEIDLLLVIDNSETMGEEQLALASSFSLLIDKLQQMTDLEGAPLNPDVNIMVTTTDVGHPTCSRSQPDGYEPAQGAPQNVACIDRLDDFTTLGNDPISFPEACTLSCPMAVQPGDPFIHFDGPNGSTTNVPGNNIKGALRCIGPQGINGCGFEAPLEAMFQAINPNAAWNQGNRPFLRDDGILAIVIITDETDCSVRAPDGYAYFVDQMNDTYWEVNPDTGTNTHATSAVCWNAGVDCGVPDGNGIYADCTSIDNDVLHPTSRYLDFLQDELVAQKNKQVVMLGILGIPEVATYNPQLPYNPTSGGISDLVYHDWIDGAWPVGEILPGDDAATNQFEFGIGPGCTGLDNMGGFTGQAIPPVRISEVCEALDDNERLHCCLDSVCDTDYSGAIGCLAGVLQSAIDPVSLGAPVRPSTQH
jgi:hypothetical protein